MFQAIFVLRNVLSPTNLNTQKCKEQLLKDVQNTLRMIYSELYINFVTKNPLYKPGDKITSQAFASQLDRQMVAMAKRFAW